MTPLRLLADMGGTHIRLALQAGSQGALQGLSVLPCADYPSAEAALRAYLASQGDARPQEAAFGMANPVSGDEVRMTNHHWSFSQAALKRAMNWQRLLVINDFTALAWALPGLPPPALRQVGGRAPVPGAAVGLVGPGTGLGVSGLTFSPTGGVVVLSGEGGHATLAAQTALEFEVLARLRNQHAAVSGAHVSAERAVCGQGLVDLYQALGQIQSLALAASPVTQAAEVTTLALQQGDALALQALDMFCAFLGDVAGNLALTLGAQGGIYIGGGIVPRWGPWFDQSSFRRRFEAKGRMRAFVEPIPCWVIEASPVHALHGVARALNAGAASD